LYYIPTGGVVIETVSGENNIKYIEPDFSYPIYKCRTFGLLVPKDFQHYLVFPSSDYERDCEMLSFYNVKNIMNNKIPL
jgi:hypothetical protein